MKNSPESSPGGSANEAPSKAPNVEQWTSEDIASAIGGAVMGAVGNRTVLRRDLQQQVQNGSEQGPVYTVETLRGYRDDRAQANHEMIARRDTHLAEVYRDLITRCPNLRNVLVRDENIEHNAFFQRVDIHPDGKRYVPAVHFNFSHPETYLKPEAMEAGDNFGFETVLKAIALKVGVQPRDVMQNRKLVTTFVMLHEFGHAYDFDRNFLQPELDKLSGKHRGIKALPAAAEQANKRRKQDLMSMPILGHQEAKTTFKGLQKAKVLGKRLRAMGLDPNNWDEVVLANHRAYRQMSSEAFADNFATSYILAHADEYFGEGEGRVPQRLDLPMRVRPEDVPLLDMDSGKGVILTQVFRNEKTGNFDPPQANTVRHHGFLAENIRVGQPMILHNGSDPYHGGGMRGPAVSNVLLQFYKGTKGRVRSSTVLQSKVGEKDVYYMLEFTGEQPDEINATPEELMKRLEIDAGSQVQLMKLDQTEKSEVRYGEFLVGQLYRPSSWGAGTAPIEMGHGIHLQSKNGRGGNTSAIQRIYRKWKTFYVDTFTSTYEIIPYE